ncbi:FecR protein [Mucilaginibacter gossypiicola]|uniref:FecR protein n=1 Tax=Mucilaginibacter gossypiicola TaxID=551995 RepID=A0A1H8UH32_9SPHI|nr:FecR family protein [Mucilaginibacter gossypiicola]SEP02337.1 FecR protein [Mucilaginibacter gossypiicola]
MTNYSDYEVEDFLHDDFFINCVLNNTADQQAFWDQWLLDNPDRKKVIDSARQIISSINIKPLANGLADDEVNILVSHVQSHFYDEKPEARTLKLYQTQWFRIAAILLMFITAGLIFLKTRTNPTSKLSLAVEANGYINITNNTTESKLIRMADGSLAVLKPGSGLRYPKSFKMGREAFLNGEAFFEIHKNPAMPFVVHSHEMAVRVMGTSFTVKSFSINNEFKVIVNTGKVLVYNQKEVRKNELPKAMVTLLPNQQVTYTAKLTLVKKETLPVPLTLSPPVAQKEFTFDDAPLSEIIDKINKAYAVNIEYDKAAIGNINLSASLSDRPLDEKIKLICKAINASCQFIDGRIIISNPGLNHSTTN